MGVRFAAARMRSAEPLSMQDRNFDDIAEKFARNIYGTTKGKSARRWFGRI